MKILIAEHWHSHIYGEPLYRRLIELGERAHAFKEVQSFSIGHMGALGALSARLQHRLHAGPRVVSLNKALIDRVDSLRPNVLFVIKGDSVYAETLETIKRKNVHLVVWHNDDPFSKKYGPDLWRHSLESLPLFDRIYAYRNSNLRDFERAGGKRATRLMSCYIRELNFPVERNSIEEKFRSDICFVGHWEDDGREDAVIALIRANLGRFKLWGTLWERARLANEIVSKVGPARPLYKLDYNAALAGAHIALAFLSKKNNDTYTRRCFEIPAAGTFMLAERSAELTELFQEGVEAEYFSSTAELIDKAAFYLRNVPARERIASAGRTRLLRDGHEALDRARQVRDDLAADLGL